MKSIRLPENVRRPFATQIVYGLLQQLNSTPCEILAITKCFKCYPELREEQAFILDSELSMNLDSLAPPIQEITPKDIFIKNATMNTAFAISCSEILNNSVIIQPYKAIGLYEEGIKLLNLIKELPDSSDNSYQKAVDSWAESLKMQNMYEWVIKER